MGILTLAFLWLLGVKVQRPRTALEGSEDSLCLQGPRCHWEMLIVIGAVPIVLSVGFYMIFFVLCHPFSGLFLDVHLHLLPARMWDGTGWNRLGRLVYPLR